MRPSATAKRATRVSCWSCPSRSAACWNHCWNRSHPPQDGHRRCLDAMILTITLNTALDRVLFLDRLESGRRNQVRRAVDAMGGKGTDVSLILAELGVPSLATGFIGGKTGEQIDAWLSAAGVSTAFVGVGGESRQKDRKS